MGKITKIIELLIDWENQDVEDVGVDIISMVDQPAIGVSWQAFTAQQFVDKIPGESKDEYVSRCIPVLIGEGYDEDQAAAICYGSFDGDEEEVEDIMDLINSDDFGQTIDAENTVYVDFTQENFNGVTDFLQGLLGLDIAGRRAATETPDIRYMYAGPDSDRPFCSAMLRLNKVYTRDELQRMGRTVGNGIDRGRDAIAVWHGGPNCRHWFNKVQIVKDGQRTLVTNLGPDNEFGVTMSSRGTLKGYTSQDAKDRSMKWWWANNKFREMQFSTDDDKMIITGPAMKAFQMIPRKDDDGNIYHVYFSEETIQKIAEKFLAEHKHNNTDINHSMIATEENTLLESWIVEDPEMDKATALGFNPSKGDWMVSYKINNKETWEKIKSGELTGFSISGQFIEKLT